MKTEPGRLAYALFSDLLGLPESQRPACLDQACGDDSTLRQQVEFLLAADSQAGSFLEPGYNASVEAPIVSKRIPARMSHYRLEQRVGCGGMGEVYRAQDTALGRLAALKVLPERFSPLLADRFAQEAEFDARLQHPGIATFFEAGDWKGVAYIAMEYVEGQSLRDRLKAGPLPWNEAIHVIGCVLEALGHAHSVGLLHRDIKPENIMITAPHTAKLLDFGIAKCLYSKADKFVGDQSQSLTSLTGAGYLVGTAGYMSPEQIRRQSLDAQSDLFAVGAILYESLTGQRAFPGNTPIECVAAVLSGAGLRLPTRGVPPELNQVLSRAVAREPKHRYPSAAAFLSDLRGLTTDEFFQTVRDSLALIDFENLSDNPDDDWIGRGIVESLYETLARMDDLTIVPRQDVIKTMSFVTASDNSPKPTDVGLALGCRWIICGDFQRKGSSLNVTVRLAEVPTCQIVETQQLDGDLERLFQMQERLSSLIVKRLRRDAPERRTPTKLDAYKCYMRGRQQQERLEKGSLERAKDLYEQAIRLDASYAPALAGLATIHGLRFTFGTNPDELSLAVEYGRRAVEADPRLADAHVWLGYALWRMNSLKEAYQEEQQAIALNSQNALGHYFAAGVMLSACQREKALEHSQRAYGADPENIWTLLVLGWAHLELGNTSEARWCLERVAEWERKGQQKNIIAGSEGCLAECLRRTGALAEARTRVLAGLEAVEASDFIYRDSFRGICFCALGRIALEQHDFDAARVAFGQAVQHHRGRPRALGGGHLLVQSLAGLTRADEGPSPFEEALRLFEDRDGFNFSYLVTCSDDISLLELARAADSLGRTQQTRELLQKARAAGSAEVSNKSGGSK